MMKQENTIFNNAKHIYVYMASIMVRTTQIVRRNLLSTAARYILYVLSQGQANVLFNDALNTFYLRLYGVRHMVKDHSDSERGNPLPPHGLLFLINSKGSFICTIPQTG